MLIVAGRPEDAVIMDEALPFGPSKKSSDEKSKKRRFGPVTVDI
jgi:hypothetical protein